MIESSKQFPETDLDAALRICQAHAAGLAEKERKRKHDLAMYQAGAGPDSNRITISYADIFGDFLSPRRYRIDPNKPD